MSMSAEPNAAQREHWSELGHDWAAAAAAMEDRLHGWGRAAIDHVGVASGESVVDVGCGAGGTTLALASAVGLDGHVLGLDISAPMIAEARRAAQASGLSNVTFEEGDAQVRQFVPDGTDLVFSRFGVMFFSNPTAAFANLGHGLRHGGRLGFACWGPPEDNTVQRRVRKAVSQVVTLPPVDLNQPGPHSLGTEDILTRVLRGAGFADLRLDLLHRSEPIGGTVTSAEEMIDGLMMIGPGRDAVAREPALKPHIAAALMDEFGGEWKPGGIWLPGAVWMVAAVWPAR
jgi:SAM-dependent methyltransferase